jgi:hypothetical protein
VWSSALTTHRCILYRVQCLQRKLSSSSLIACRYLRFLCLSGTLLLPVPKPLYAATLEPSYLSSRSPAFQLPAPTLRPTDGLPQPRIVLWSEVSSTRTFSPGGEAPPSFHSANLPFHSSTSTVRYIFFLRQKHPRNWTGREEGSPSLLKLFQRCSKIVLASLLHASRRALLDPHDSAKFHTTNAWETSL